MGKKKAEFNETEVVEKPADLPLAPRQLWMITDRAEPRYGENWRIISFLEPAEEGGPTRVKYQYQIPLGPGRPAETHKGCPQCGYGVSLSAMFNIPATRQRDEMNVTKVGTEEALRREWKEVGAVMVEKGLIDVETV